MRKIFVPLLALFVFAYILRVFFLSNLSLTFLYDQARDAYIVEQILDGDLKILGPPSSTPGLYHGVFYYYLLAPAYWLGNGSPVAATYWIAFLNSLAVFIVFYLGYLLTKNLVAGFFCSFLYAISFEAVQYATWLSNPTIGVWTVPLIYLGLWLWTREKNNWGAFIAAVGLGLSIQAEIFLVYHIVPASIWIYLNRSKIARNTIVQFTTVLAILLSTLILAEVKFGFQAISGISKLATVQSGSFAYTSSVGDYLVLYLNQIGRTFAFNSYPGNVGYAGVFVLVLVICGVYRFWSKKKVDWSILLALWLFSHVTVVTLGGSTTPFLTVGIGSGVSVLLGVYLSRWWKTGFRWLVMLLLLVFTFGNLSTIAKENPQGSTLFAIQKDMVLEKQLKAIDYTYKQADGEDFSLNSLTSPLWINIVWSYLYKWYGLPKYGYLPQWHGKNQIGQLDSLPPTSKDTSTYFLIIEPMAGIPAQYLELTIGEEDSVSELVLEESFGEIRVQKRLRKI